MRLKVLGCSGGIGGNLHTTSFLLDRDVLIDAGSGVSELSLSELREIDHVFITHSHLDHICCLPFLIDSVGWMRSHPLTVYASKATLDALKRHIFNWVVWPDFTEIPNAEKPVMRFREIALGEVVDLQGRKIRSVPAHHTVPAVGYHLDSGQSSLVFSGDTHINDRLWEVVNRIENLRYLLIETAFSEGEKNLAELSLHLCPSLLAGELAKFTGEAEIFITHLKPGEVEMTMREIESCVGALNPQMLLNNQEFEF
ncbi:MAG: 3',5'-cyclic-nucleotide phosphodiesterase [Gallionellaceae bacterium CG1_02_56_997]|nr:MAG: 3',5'-cyclic-nucleotide phosphodiesterase [Gallionellaceae bacterium CG1_02_56_997]PIV14598.1 MAG: 3',5'-cyclic-nucleotide phosphodiesterase [Gallionellales bacterium CG03_land_8_20_14_0_80_55_15]HCJ51296.1 3',5'-cyclic-nucleotide phosphodiesterase [Gallionella sp.]